MLDMLLTADAASKHGHEAASPPSTTSNNGSFLVQMPLAIIGSVLRLQTPSPAAPPASTAPEASTPRKGAMSALPDTPLASPTHSRPVSSASSVTTDHGTKKRASRPKTSYVCARPARPINKLHLRPKVILQLHQVIASQRPKPTYEVIPFSLLPPRSTRRLARTFNTRDKLCPNDLLVVKAEEYGSIDDETKTDEECWGSRDVVGVICPAKGDKGVTDICMDDGASRWEVTNMPNGGFEFNTTNDHGLTLKARWVLKPPIARRVSAMSTSSHMSPSLAPVQDDKKYTFSTISASTRRHPIIATMTRSRIDIMDSYTMPSAASPPTPGSLLHTQTPALTPTSINADSFFPNEQLPIQTDDALRRFILVTGVWVASQTDCTSNASQPPTPSTEPCPPLRTMTSRTVSMSFLDYPRSVSPSSTSDEHQRSFPKLLRSGRERLPRSTSFTEPSPSPLPVRTTSNASPVLKSRSRRANSTGNTNLHSMSGSMRRRFGLAFEDQALLESEEERQAKRSVELMRIKELALPTSEPPLLSPSLLSPPAADPERSRKTQSAYNPVTTAGLWDSGVSERPGLKSRPTSMSVIMDKQKKQDRKRERSKTKEERRAKNDDKDVSSLKKTSEWRKFKTSLKHLFRREKS
ncbi:hypothetical protein DE146DRAFT_614141 [Phaeosphaeria sp. MPI-PUGE-AT-0046c]|nr:hypothetical protein DE146DRAFT_614141 [Phaeosphaeria sp. MPI-PUGE-AT-0046c]